MKKKIGYIPSLPVESKSAAIPPSMPFNIESNMERERERNGWEFFSCCKKWTNLCNDNNNNDNFKWFFHFVLFLPSSFKFIEIIEQIQIQKK